jgi:hypothetical protein
LGQEGMMVLVDWAYFLWFFAHIFWNDFEVNYARASWSIYQSITFVQVLLSFG